MSNVSLLILLKGNGSRIAVNIPCTLANRESSGVLAAGKGRVPVWSVDARTLVRGSHKCKPFVRITDLIGSLL